MKIKQLLISNILSFKYVANIDEATKIIFDKSLNIFIGENGAGKSTALEVINFIFRKILFKHFNVNQDLLLQKDRITISDKKNILSYAGNDSYSEFRLEPNWDRENESQKIKLVIELDEIDNTNIKNLITNQSKLNSFASLYANHSASPETTTQKEYVIEITLNKVNKNFSAKISPNSSDPGYLYLTNYNFYKELINLYNYENPNDLLAPLYESFALIGSYRNYHDFTPSISLQQESPASQRQQIKNQENVKSLNANEQSEPSIFKLVRLRVAEAHYELGEMALTPEQREDQANNLPFIISINKRLKLVNLECKIRVSERRTRQYAFEFLDIKRKKVLSHISALSAGQKAIIHLVFEAYGRGELRGGVVIIDEPEIHLHHQFQNEYLRVIEEINKDQECQYVLVTHSESLINSTTIHNVKRFALDDKNHTAIKAPVLSTDDQKLLIKILDNTRSTYAFFAKKVVLVEGDTDRYFFKSVMQEIKPEFNQEIAILDIGGKGGFAQWKAFFENFGLTVYCIGDLDSARQFIYGDTKEENKLDTKDKIDAFKKTHPNLLGEIEQKYSEKIYILKSGSLEDYLGISKNKKGLPSVIKFCNDNLNSYLRYLSNEESKEVKFIIDELTK
jgi:predicted ATP-dependent endonuclease of OLD family